MLLILRPELQDWIRQLSTPAKPTGLSPALAAEAVGASRQETFDRIHSHDFQTFF